MAGRKLTLRILQLGIPLVVGVLWGASGWEVLTKSAKAVDVEVADELFGDTIVQTELIRGPILGYYVGIDLVIAAILLSTTAGALHWLWGRRRARKPAIERALR